MTRLLPLCLVLLGCGPGEDLPEDPVLDTLSTAQRLAEEGVARWPSDALALSWIETVWHFGLHRVHLADADPRWTGAIDDWLTRGIGFFEGTDPRTFDSSDSMSPSTLASLRLKDDPGAAWTPIVDAAWHYLDEEALTTSEGAITHWGPGTVVADTDEVWVDSQFMFGMFFLTEYDRTGERQHLERFVAQYRLFSELCRDPADQLYRHAYKDSTGENIPSEATYWARGNSWVLISAAELLHRVPADDPLAAEIAPLFRTHAEATMAVQAEDGLWHTVMNEPRGEDPANYTESSASALIAYALVRGVEAGALEADAVDPVVSRAAFGLQARLTEVDGQLSLSGTSFGTNPGDYDYYVSVPRFDDQVLGVGSVLMFFAEADGRPEVP